MTRRIGAGRKRQFGIGFVASTLYSTLPELIRSFRLRAPDVEIVLSELTTLEQVAALKQGRIDIGFGRLLFNEDAVTRRVLHEEKLSVAVPPGHILSRHRRPVKLKHTVDGPLILYPKAPRPSYADQVLSFYRKMGLEPKVGFEARELQTALGLVAAGVGIALVPSSVRRLGRNDVKYVALDEAEIVSPIIVSFRSNDRSSLLARFLQPIPELDLHGKSELAAIKA